MKKLIQVLFLILLCILLTGLIILRAQQGPAPEGDVVPGSDIDTADDMSLPDDMMADDMGMTDDMNMTDGIGMDDDMGMMDNMGIPDDMMEEPEPTPTPEPTPEPTWQERFADVGTSRGYQVMLDRIDTEMRAAALAEQGY